MDRVKYIAEGFANDAEKLLCDFIGKNSTEFPVFAEIWKKHNFSCIYLGRSSEKELHDFTHEIFRLTTNFLKSTSFLTQVGGIFLLYALYRNQILSPPVKIRIMEDEFKSILDIRDMFAVESRSLHYVINYLIENSFYFVMYPFLMGPKSVRNLEAHDKTLGEYHPDFPISKRSALTELYESNVLKEIEVLYAQYVEACQLLNVSTLGTFKSGTFKDLASRIEELQKWVRKANKEPELNNCPEEKELEPPPSHQTTPDISIGSRRAQLKAMAFGGTFPSFTDSPENHPGTSGINEGIEPICNGISVPNDLAPKKQRIKGKRRIVRSKRCTSEEVNERSESEPNSNNIEDAPERLKRRKRRSEAFAKTRHYYMDKKEGNLTEPISLTDVSLDIVPKDLFNIASDSDDSDVSADIDDALLSGKEDVESFQLTDVEKV
ncbi:uncharacterized protein NPIL_238041 [Nephila pilipes]|uniref:snRNA-activating protein complex subunit 1 n=1 Tax=Nephila pilipes TaxID=299642 RepID=A0A8X6IEH2_NEPPI|nr:uncharacterized protein NPIL_238041 [Nephila pilipes]